MTVRVAFANHFAGILRVCVRLIGRAALGCVRSRSSFAMLGAEPRRSLSEDYDDDQYDDSASQQWILHLRGGFRVTPRRGRRRAHVLLSLSLSGG